MSIVAVNHQDTTNLGDLVCSPCLYFDFGDVVFSDVRKAPPKADAYIFGGGAMFNRAQDFRVPGVKIAWGLGQTIRGASRSEQKAPVGFELFGSRDIDQPGAEWVPCASCMSPLFDLEYEVKHEAVLYLNRYPDKTVPAVEIDDLPMAYNRGTFEDALRFIGSGNVCVTNSYHGAYWATLMGRAAVVVNPYSSKFYNFKYQPAVSSSENWRNAKARTFPQALAKCRAANEAFETKVRSLLCSR